MEIKQETRKAGSVETVPGTTETVETSGTRGTANRKANHTETAIKDCKTASKAERKASGTKPGKKQGRKPGTKPAAKLDKSGSVITGNQSGSVDNIGSVPARKRGRPKGSKNKTIRNDHAIHTEPGENTKFLSHDIKLYSLPEIDINDLQSVQDRINTYFSICADDDIKPTMESLALAFGVSRFTLFDYLAGRNKGIHNPACIHAIKKTYDIINSYYVHMMNYGKINPVAGIFLMKNNMGYKDQTDYTISTNNNQQLTLNDIANRANLLDE